MTTTHPSIDITSVVSSDYDDTFFYQQKLFNQPSTQNSTAELLTQQGETSTGRGVSLETALEFMTWRWSNSKTRDLPNRPNQQETYTYPPLAVPQELVQRPSLIKRLLTALKYPFQLCFASMENVV